MRGGYWLPPLRFYFFIIDRSYSFALAWDIVLRGQMLVLFSFFLMRHDVRKKQLDLLLTLCVRISVADGLTNANTKPNRTSRHKFDSGPNTRGCVWFLDIMPSWIGCEFWWSAVTAVAADCITLISTWHLIRDEMCEMNVMFPLQPGSPYSQQSYTEALRGEWWSKSNFLFLFDFRTSW